ncbi:MAG: hypothetical protein ABNO60_00785 [Candidatus Shikimatogenerans sp. Tcar]|uniref:Uncharacterized protein n=1 Tax=Candidatus Shikimatogenerans sp. Tcar TaxID=3158565 RepID=A0AAU7QS79_9FLAO
MFYYKFNKKYKIFRKKKKNNIIFYKNFFFKFYINNNNKKKININFYFINKIKNSIIRNNIKNKIKHIIQEYFIFFLLIKKNIYIQFCFFNNFKYILCKKYILLFLKNYLK